MKGRAFSYQNLIHCFDAESPRAANEQHHRRFFVQSGYQNAPKRIYFPYFNVKPANDLLCVVPEEECLSSAGRDNFITLTCWKIS